MHTVIGIRFIIEGFHCFPKATEVFNSDVDFLEKRHRHIFYITCEVKVFHDNRDKEFILLQREMKQYIVQKYGNPAEFGVMSCEMIARDLFNTFDCNMVEVSEDNENYAKIIK